ncbi:MAG: npdG, partial [Xanthobacteraceae bacterium]|nr:npdG [Xanthobacteraceae bacterium]
MTDPLPTIAILGGTGDLGSGLAKRLLAAGYRVVIGSRSAEKAKTFAASLDATAGQVL